MEQVEAVIRLHAYEPCIITTGEYEELQKEVQGRIFAGDAGVGDRILLKLLEEHHSRYHECLLRNTNEPDLS